MARTKLTLQDVARTAADKNGGKGGRSLQRIAEKKGLTLSFTTVDRILAGKYESTPQRPTIEALAQLADMPIEDVYEAAGLPLPMAALADQLPDGSDLLTVHQRRVVLDVIRGFIRDNDRMADLERERDERVPERSTLLDWVNERDEAALEAMDIAELYEMLQVLNRAVPSMDEAEALVAYTVTAEKVLVRREGRETSSGDLEDPAQPDGLNGPAAGERRRGSTVRATPFRKGRGGRTSGSRPKLVSDDVNDDVLELPYAADNSEDPGEDYR
ncbi:MAG: hypothetical protein ACTIA5_01655 [Brachybacterium tyrofermentans]